MQSNTTTIYKVLVHLVDNLDFNFLLSDDHVFLEEIPFLQIEVGDVLLSLDKMDVRQKNRDEIEDYISNFLIHVICFIFNGVFR